MSLIGKNTKASFQAYVNDRTRELRDKADIRALMELHSNLDWDKIKRYAEVFDQWQQILEMKNRVENNR